MSLHFNRRGHFFSARLQLLRYRSSRLQPDARPHVLPPAVAYRFILNRRGYERR